MFTKGFHQLRELVWTFDYILLEEIGINVNINFYETNESVSKYTILCVLSQNAQAISVESFKVL